MRPRPEGVRIGDTDVDQRLRFSHVDEAGVALWLLPVTPHEFDDMVRGLAKLTLGVLPAMTAVSLEPWQEGSVGA